MPHHVRRLPAPRSHAADRMCCPAPKEGLNKAAQNGSIDTLARTAQAHWRNAPLTDNKSFRHRDFLVRRRFEKRYFERMRIALFQPDIPQNTGTILRLCACLDAEAHIIEPAGFPITDRNFRRAGMDYLDGVRLVRHQSWRTFEQWRHDAGARLLLLTTAGEQCYLEHRYRTDDVLLLGRESAGAPPEVHVAADARLVIPMARNLRSLNVAMAAAIVLGEALRQTDGLATVTARSNGQAFAVAASKGA
jgi:tRNA (cytidine/uridine-2'-O-)-methyltransferase